MSQPQPTVTRPIVSVQKLMTKTPQELNRGLKTNIIVRFDDGVEKPLTFREVIVNRYVWDIFKLFNNLPILSTFDITNNYVAGYYVSNTLNKTYETILRYLIDNVMEPSGSRDALDAIWHKMQTTYNDIYNEIVFNNLDYVSSLDINTFLDIQLHPDLVAAMRKVNEANISKADEVAESIENAYKVLHNILTSDEYHNNKIAQGYISKTMNQKQLKQVLGPRGNITNLSEELYKKPIPSSFTSGMYGIDELGMESQTGAKALRVSTTAVSSSEFFARKMQLVMGRVERCVDGNCGQTDYEEWEVLPDNGSRDNPVKCHLPLLVGKYYYNEETKKEELITENHKHLIGKKIKLRVAYKCKWHDKRCICSRCFGQMAYNIPKHSHIGHYSATVITKEMTQKSLSFKHEISSANALPITINPLAREDFETKAEDNTHVFLRKKYVIDKVGGLKEVVFDNKKDFDISIKVAVSSARGLADITPATDVKRFAPTSVSMLYNLWLVKTNRETGEVREIPIEIRKGRKVGSFTTEFLLHIQKADYKIDADENIIIPLDGWDMNKPIIFIPDVEFSYINYSKSISKLFGASINGSGKRKVEADSETDDVYSINTQSGFLHRLFTEVNSRLSINIALIEVIVAAFSVNNYEAGDYSVAHGSESASTRNIKTILTNGSMGAAYAYQEHMDTMMSPTAFDTTQPVNHIMDVYLAPAETIADYNSHPIKI
nr:MAG TPA: DNA-directed RNA polymerase subunit alpha [Caudoviricetes sp.]